MAYLAFNGKVLMRASKWIGYRFAEPVPISGNGVIRFRFSNSDVRIDESVLNQLTHSNGQWVPVLDVNTGLPIEGLWDYEYVFTSGFPIRRVFNNMTPSKICGADVDIVEIKDSRPVPIDDFWATAFDGATALRKVHITQLSPGSDSLRMFDSCSGLTEAYVKCDTFGSTQNMFSDCTGLRKLYISTSDRLDVGVFNRCSSLSDLTIEWTGNNDGRYLYDGNSALQFATSLEEVTLIHPYNVTVTLNGQSSYNVFQNLTHLRHVNHLVNNNGVLEPDAMPVVGNIDRMFYGCTSLEAIPSLRAMEWIQCSFTFYGCRSVRSGIIAAYEALAPLVGEYQHRSTFQDCGVDTATGSAELEQIPDSWK